MNIVDSKETWTDTSGQDHLDLNGSIFGIDILIWYGWGSNHYPSLPPPHYTEKSGIIKMGRIKQVNLFCEILAQQRPHQLHF